MQFRHERQTLAGRGDTCQRRPCTLDAFYSDRTGDREIWAIPADGGRARQLTSSPGLDAGTEWSPDGSEINFRSERMGSSDMWVVSADGRRLRRLTAGPAIDYYSSWSPDGRWIAFTSNQGGRRQIWRVPAAGGSSERLSRGETHALTWSADGASIFFVGDGERSGNVWSLSIETRSESPVTDLRGRRATLGEAMLSTDGQWLYFGWREDVGDIWVMDVVAGSSSH